MMREPFPTPIVSTEWLAEHLDHAEIKVVDASTYLPMAGRDAKAEYAEAHIPGAVFADFDRLHDTSAPMPHTMPAADAFAASVEALGISSTDAVVVYDASGQNFSAPRLWFMLRTFGHRRVAVLDGGLKKWMKEGRALTTEVPAPLAGDFNARLDERMLRDMSAMRDLEAHRRIQVVDARSPGRYAGTEAEPRPGVRSGHIPGSVNLHYAKLVHADGTLRSAYDLQELVANAGLDVTRPIVASCGSGVTACAVLLALDALGVEDTSLYDGSWTEWGGATDTPVSRGRIAFTLIEVLVVIVVIAILATLVAPNLFRHVGAAKDATARAQIEMLGTALDAYRLDVGIYPNSRLGLQALMEKPDADAGANWRGPYLRKAVPLDPWRKPYVYVAPGVVNRNSYDLLSYGADGVAGGDGDNADIVSWK